MVSADELYTRILADRDDMDLRLRYADAIDPVDPDHADLIRWQITGQPPVRERGYHLGGAIAARWNPLFDGLTLDWHLERGFPDNVKMDAAVFVARGDEILGRFPVRKLRLKDVGGHIGAVAADPLLSGLAALDAGGSDIGDDGARLLAASPYLRRLRFLSLRSSGIGPEGAEAIAASPNLPALETLDLIRNRVDMVPYLDEWIDQGVVVGSDLIVPPFGQHIIDTYGPLRWMRADTPAWSEI